eukprot:9358423-Pyramimonas_sp.AAC.1
MALSPCSQIFDLATNLCGDEKGRRLKAEIIFAKLQAGAASVCLKLIECNSFCPNERLDTLVGRVWTFAVDVFAKSKQLAPIGVHGKDVAISNARKANVPGEMSAFAYRTWDLAIDAFSHA